MKKKFLNSDFIQRNFSSTGDFLQANHFNEVENLIMSSQD